VSTVEVESPREFFEETLYSRFKSDRAKGIDAIVQVDITGPDGGSWTVTIRDQKIEVKEGTHPSPMLSVSVTDRDFTDLINGKLSGERAFFTGKIRLKGNIGLALKLRDAGVL
jgi:putative sterol carrier protein